MIGPIVYPFFLKQAKLGKYTYAPRRRRCSSIAEYCVQKLVQGPYNNAAVHGQPRDWKRRRGRPTHTWIRTVEAYLKPANIGRFSAWRWAQDRNACSGLIRTAMPQCGVRSWWWWWSLHSNCLGRNLSPYSPR